MQSYDLPVYVRQAYAVIVKQVKLADTATGKHLNGIAAHTTYTEHSHTAVFQCLYGRIA